MDAIDGVSYGALPSLGTCWAAPLTTIDWVVQEETEADLQELLGEDYEVYQQGYSSDPGGGGGHADLFDSDSDSEDEAEFLEKEHLDPGLHRFDPFATRTEDDLVTPKKKNLQKKRGRKPGASNTCVSRSLASLRLKKPFSMVTLPRKPVVCIGFRLSTCTHVRHHTNVYIAGIL